MKKDIIIIGGGIIGCAAARLLSAYEADIGLLERGADVAEGASKANSGIVHAGFDAAPGSLKAKLNVRGAEMYGDLSRELGVPFGRPGALVLAFDAHGRESLENLRAQGERNGVKGLRILERNEALSMEPQLNPEILCALHAPTSGLTSPYEMTYALADHAAAGGVSFHLDTEVTAIEKQKDGFLLRTSKGDFTARIVVNCAGIGSAALHNDLSDTPLTITPRKGEYYLFDHEQPLPFTQTIFQTPTKMGKGVLVSPTVHGNMLLGPTAEDVKDGRDVSTSADALKDVIEKSRLTWPGLNQRATITTFAGIRAHAAGDDFVIGPVTGAPGAYEAVGIESPGLTAAPAIAEMLCERIASENGLIRKQDWPPAPKRPKAFSAMTLEERAKAVQENPDYGSIVCRCETVTEAEIRAAIRRPVGARSIDGVKRRTRAGMGRCQGGFCSPRVLEILAEELQLSPLDITKSGGRSFLLTSTIDQVPGKEDA